MDTAISRKIDRISDNLDRIERGLHGDLSLSYCSDYISWVAKFKKVPREIWEPICDKITKMFQEGYN